MKGSNFVCVLLLMFTGALYAQTTTVPSEVIQTATDDFSQYLKNAVPDNVKTLLGFDVNDNLSKATLGTPFQLYNLSADSIRNYKDNTPIRSIITESLMWYFPVMIDNTVKMVMYVGKKDSVWMRAGLGSAGLAKHLQDITTRWSPTKGYTPILIHQFDIGAYLFSIPQVDNFNLTETGFSVPKPGLNKSSPQLKTLSNTIKDLRSRISR